MILNELSMHGNIQSVNDLRIFMHDFIEICHKLSSEKGDNDFYYTEDLMLNNFISGYSLHDWLRDENVPMKEKAYVRKIINRKQLLRPEDFSESQLLIRTSINKMQNALGCLAAYEWEKYVVSFLTDEVWRQEQLLGLYVTMDETDKEVLIRNCSTVLHVDELILDQQKQCRLYISSGSELWDKRSILYPHLIFCECVKKQMEEARVNLHIEMIMKRLQILEDYFADFDGNFDKEKLGHRCRPESESVQEDDELKRMRVFETPYGEKVFFSWHISFAGNFPGRIHFYPDAVTKKGIIGYVGKHLPTKRFKTV